VARSLLKKAGSPIGVWSAGLVSGMIVSCRVLSGWAGN
jgi:hypothetical protein